MEVKVYSTPTCPWCKVLKTFLKEKGVEFKEIDVSQDPAAAMEMMKKSGQLGVPQTEIGGKIILGFDKKAIEEALHGTI